MTTNTTFWQRFAPNVWFTALGLAITLWTIQHLTEAEAQRVLHLALWTGGGWLWLSSWWCVSNQARYERARGQWLTPCGVASVGYMAAVGAGVVLHLTGVVDWFEFLGRLMS